MTAVKLYMVATSPYARKVLAFAHETGLIDRIETVAAKLTPTDPDQALNRVNPLGKVPALVLDDGGAMFDSTVICEYLDSLHDGAPRFPPAGPARWRVLRVQALANGLLDAAVLARLEGAVRPEAYRWDGWIALQKGKIARALDALEGEAAGFGEPFDTGQIATACALGYLDLRYAADRWRDGRPALAAWGDRALARPSLAKTAPPAG